MKMEPRPRSKLNAALSHAGLVAWLAAGVVLLAGSAQGSTTEEPPAAAAESAPDTVPGLPPVSPAERRYVPDYTLRTGDEVILVLVGGSFCMAHRVPGFAQTDEALEFLSAFGEFDELSVGSNWVNGSAFRYIWNDLPGEPVVPQVVVVQRHLDTSGRAIRVTDERVVRRIRGSDDIMAWVRSGAEL